jgi:hypothetical protein
MQQQLRMRWTWLDSRRAMILLGVAAVAVAGVVQVVAVDDENFVARVDSIAGFGLRTDHLKYH